jgi:hypothetical protein
MNLSKKQIADALLLVFPDGIEASEYERAAQALMGFGDLLSAPPPPRPGAQDQPVMVRQADAETSTAQAPEKIHSSRRPFQAEPSRADRGGAQGWPSDVHCGSGDAC